MNALFWSAVNHIPDLAYGIYMLLWTIIYIYVCFTEESAKNIGIHGYYPQVRKAFSNILRILDGQIGKVFMMTKPENKDKDLDELIG